MSRIATVLLCGAIALTPTVGFADSDSAFADSEATLEKIVVEMADTMEEHSALAHYYRAKATDARSEAKRHDQMSRSYSVGKMPQRNKMKKHCKKISEQYTEMANEYDGLANLHEAGAK